ncbi:glycosyltransferase [Anabaena sp. UHCC 0399]|uniref:glycosyltransferase n=1 Tax=Anabaena sp. UHCC 0399 TaxID=3110238 RepID=UPI002B20A733|nr:glycosyltransferase [Anabaena sp. UHCC 0399]MEA5566118.1 glycosyltransferase [Anabaena sp. UHCC 0399]
MNTLISVIIPTHNPNLTRLQRTLDGLRSQSLSYSDWCLIIVDNASSNPDLFANLDISWHPNTKIIREERLGLTRARLAGIQANECDYLIFVDDDNVLCPNYLQDTIKIFHTYPSLGAIGGKSLPEFEVEPESWVKQFWGCLALRDLGDDIQIYAYEKESHSQKQHPIFAPIGAGMVLRRQAAEFYVQSILNDNARLALDRTGKSLQSGGDCDINLTLLDGGWAVGYFPQLQLTHLISANRLTKNYLARLNYSSSRSWVQVLDAHNIRPWNKIPAWSVVPRKVKAFINYKALIHPANYVRWQGMCGMFEGLGILK